MVVISSASHLGRGGTAAYAGDVVRAAVRIREVYGKNVRVVHGFPLIGGGGLVDDSTVRGLREIELWLAEVDKRRLGSLPQTSKYFINNYLSTTSSSNTSINHRQALKLPLALHSPESGTFVSPGWEDLPRSLPSLGEEDEAAFLNVMLSELNEKFALQLDTCPNTDRTTQFATEDPEEERASVSSLGQAMPRGSLTIWSRLTLRSSTPRCQASVLRNNLSRNYPLTWQREWRISTRKIPWC